MAEIKQGTEGCPPVLTKKDICVRLGLLCPSMRPNYERLYRAALTDKVLEKCGLTAAEVRVRSFRSFTRQQSIILIEELAL